MEEQEVQELVQAGAGNVSPRPPSSPEVPDKYSMKTSQSLNLSKKNLAELPAEAVENALEAKVQAVDLSKNQILEFPENLEKLMPQLYELNLSSNKLTTVPSLIAGNLIQFLELSNNRLSNLPHEVQWYILVRFLLLILILFLLLLLILFLLQVAGMMHLREIILSVNQFEAIPDCLYSCSKLETILIANNRVVNIEVEKLSQLPMLAVLDLQNNAIQTVPPQLGNVTQLRQVQLEGNLFR